MSAQRLFAAIALALSLIYVTRAQDSPDPPGQVKVSEGETAILNCRYDPSVITDESEVKWHIQRDADIPVPCNNNNNKSAPLGRFTCQWPASEGHAWLCIVRARPEDAGRYACSVAHGNDTAGASTPGTVVDLLVGRIAAAGPDSKAPINKMTTVLAAVTSTPKMTAPSSGPDLSNATSSFSSSSSSTTTAVESGATAGVDPTTVAADRQIGTKALAATDASAAPSESRATSMGRVLLKSTATPTGGKTAQNVQGPIIGISIALMCAFVFVTIAIYFVTTKVLSRCTGRSRSIRLNRAV
uniref:Uncharacterized protein LOC116952668 isoform X2 n=1 Tax=Petromyzon marinus TaxID=7757 RepID=A0AAJ7U1S8_PETMA|nr:uncharacterized protein LOC116952668 isoform X2 [Petromyzon marinus]